MAHTFTIDLSGKDLNAILSKVRTQITSNGGQFTGDGHGGNFSGSGVVGSYVVSGALVTITITKKPFIASNKMVESKIRSYFA